MVEFRKLSEHEVEGLRERRRTRSGPSQRALIRGEYTGYLKTLKRGDWGELTLEDGENRNTVRARLHRAATHAGMKLEFKRSRGNTMHFEVK